MPQPILIRIHKKTLVPTKRQIKHQYRSDWKIRGIINYEDSQEIFFVLGGLIKTDAQFAKAIFDDFGPGEYMCIYWRKGMKGFRNFINLKCFEDGYFMQIKPSVYKSSNKPKGPFPYLASIQQRYKIHEYEGYEIEEEEEKKKFVTGFFDGDSFEELSYVEPEEINVGVGFF